MVPDYTCRRPLGRWDRRPPDYNHRMALDCRAMARFQKAPPDHILARILVVLQTHHRHHRRRRTTSYPMFAEVLPVREQRLEDRLEDRGDGHFPPSIDQAVDRWHGYGHR